MMRELVSTLLLFTAFVAVGSPMTKSKGPERPFGVLAPINFQAEANRQNSNQQLPSAETGSERIYKGKEIDKKVVVKSKPQPEYTSRATDDHIRGTVVLRCVFASTGKVTNIHVVTGLPDGLTESAIDAAKRIKFSPALKDGKPVSVWMELQYNFKD